MIPRYACKYALMRYGLACLSLFLITTLLGQRLPESATRQMGLDISSTLVFMTGANGPAEVEFLYREQTGVTTFRAKLILSRANQYDVTLLNRTLVGDNGEELTYISNTYEPLSSYFVGLGATKDLRTLGLVTYYYGIDVLLGFSRGNIYTYEETVSLRNRDEQLLQVTQHRSPALSVLPLFGLKINLSTRTILGLEFGLPFHYNFNRLEYFNRDLEAQPLRLSSFYFDGQRILNDLFVVFTF